MCNDRPSGCPFGRDGIGHGVTVAGSNVMTARCVAKRVIGVKRAGRKGYVADQRLAPFAVALPGSIKIGYPIVARLERLEPSSTLRECCRGTEHR